MACLINRTNKMLTKKVRTILLAILIVAACIQRVTVIELVAPVKAVHIIGAFMSPLLILYRSTSKFNKKVFAVIAFLYIQTVISYLKFGLNLWFLNMIFCTLAFALTWRLSDDFDWNDWLWIGKASAVIIYFLIGINIIRNANGIWEFLLSPNLGKPQMSSTIFGGGVNMDSSWLGLFCFLAAGSAWWFPIITLTVVFSIIANSRAGILTGFAFLVWAFVQWIRRKKNASTTILFWKDWKLSQKVYCVFLSVLVIAIYITMQMAAFLIQKGLESEQVNSFEWEAFETQENQSALGNIIDRFQNIGDEPGSLGRINMWKWVPQEFRENIWGYGLGNGIEQVRKNDPRIRDSNIHNIYFQIALDQGILGLIILVVIVVSFIRNEISGLFSNPFAAFLLCYLGLGIIQFRLLEVVLWMIVAAYINCGQHNA